MKKQYVCLATIGDPGEARVAAARLQNEGLAVRIHGESTGPFPVTVGGLAVTQLWVLADETDDAIAVLEDMGVACSPQETG
jgi:hypothetical protein